MFVFRFEAIPATVRFEFITVRLWIGSPGAQLLNCGLLVMRHEELAALALRPPQSDLVACEVVVFGEADVLGFVESLVGAAA